jgi:hypothetical protein
MRIAKYCEMLELTQEQPVLLLHITAAHNNNHKAPCSTLVELLYCQRLNKFVCCDLAWWEGKVGK